MWTKIENYTFKIREIYYILLFLANNLNASSDDALFILSKLGIADHSNDTFLDNHSNLIEDLEEYNSGHMMTIMSRKISDNYLEKYLDQIVNVSKRW